MKIRNGFVSNSSSSSFTIKLEKPIEEYTYEEFCNYFEYNDPLRQIYNEINTYGTDLGDNKYRIYAGSDEGTSEAEEFLYNKIYERSNIVEDAESHH